MNDLFEHPGLIPNEVSEILNTFDENTDNTYFELGRLQKQLEKIGYTFDFYLDAQPYNLRKL
jgi:hypothetical protein